MTRSIETARPAGDSDRHTAVRRLLAPYGVEEFVRDHWEARPLVIRRDAPDYYADLITLTQFEDLLDTRPDIAAGIRILREGREAPIERLSKLCTTPSLERIYAHYREGATLSLTHLHKHWNPLADLCRDLGEVFSIGCQTNSYLTPRASRGLTGHFDTHDVLVLQVAGSKRWRTGGNPVPLPLPHQTSAGVRNPLYDQEFDLDAGDLLYLPRGYLHEAEALDGVSFHLTIGLLPLTYAELLAAEVEKVLEGDVAFRRGLPVGFHRDPDARRTGWPPSRVCCADCEPRSTPSRCWPTRAPRSRSAVPSS